MAFASAINCCTDCTGTAGCTTRILGAFVVNVTGGFLMGALTEAMALKFNLSPEMRAFLTTGILGGYTTFSTFSLEAALLIQRQVWGQATLYIAGSALLSILALFAGLWLMRAVYA